jgi:hypothetical protein
MDIILIEIQETIENIQVQIAETVENITIEINEAGTQGAQGEAGNISRVICGGSISSGNVIYLSGGLAYRFDPTNGAIQNMVYGIAKQAGNPSDEIEVYTFGIVEVAGWGLAIDTKYYAGLNGTLTTNPNTLLIEYIGVSVTSDKLLIKNLSILNS